MAPPAAAGKVVTLSNGGLAGVYSGDASIKDTDALLLSMLAGYDYCRSAGQLALVSTPVSLGKDQRSFAAAFECIETVHAIIGIGAMNDFKRGGVIVHPTKTSPSPFQDGDLVLKVGAERVKSQSQLMDLVQKQTAGPIRVIVDRDHKRVDVIADIADITPSVNESAKKVLASICGQLSRNASAPSCSRLASNR